MYLLYKLYYVQVLRTIARQFKKLLTCLAIILRYFFSFILLPIPYEKTIFEIRKNEFLCKHRFIQRTILYIYVFFFFFFRNTYEQSILKYAYTSIRKIGLLPLVTTAFDPQLLSQYVAMYSKNCNIAPLLHILAAPGGVRFLERIRAVFIANPTCKEKNVAHDPNRMGVFVVF